MQLEPNIMTSAKKTTTEMLDKLPESSSFEDIQYHLYALGKIQKGLDDVEQGRTMIQQEMEEQMRDKWLI